MVITLQVIPIHVEKIIYCLLENELDILHFSQNIYILNYLTIYATSKKGVRHHSLPCKISFKKT